MGINVIWQDERSAEIDRVNDPHRYLSLMVLACPLDEFICLRFLDPYGNTYFNRLQIPVLLLELTKIRQIISDSQFRDYYANRAKRAKEAGWQNEVIEQLEVRSGRPVAEKVRKHLDIVMELAGRSADGIHTYLRFAGE